MTLDPKAYQEGFAAGEADQVNSLNKREGYGTDE
jgi:hypothetical protein